MNQFNRVVTALAMVGAFAWASAPVWAHHSFAMFDQTKISEQTGASVAQFRFTNPHSFVVVNVKEGEETVRYVFELSSVNMLNRAGWKFNTLKAGDEVDVAFYPLRNGKPGGMLKTIKVPDGRTLSGW